MNDLRTAAQHTLEALEHHGRCLPWNAFVEVRKDLRDALAQQAEPTRSQQMVAAGFKPRDRRLKCDDCGEKFTAQMLPIHKCAQQAEPVEPVAWNWMLDGLPYGQAYYGNPPDTDIAERAAIAGRTVRLLYTAPPQRKPLPKHDQHCVDVPGYGLMAVRLVRAVERAHGIKE